MKKVISLLVAMMVLGQTAWAQLVPHEDPIGTVYRYETEGQGSKVILNMTLLNKSDKSFTVRMDQNIPNIGDISYESMHTMDNKFIYTSLDEMKKAFLVPLEKAGAVVDTLELTGSPMVTPLQGKVGDEYHSPKMTMKMEIMGMSVITTSTMVSRKIVRKEKITLPSGTFDTLVMETITETETESMGSTEKNRLTVLNWIVPGRGSVQNIQTNDNGDKTIVKLIEIKRP